MTRREMELKFRQLNLEYQKKSADINRRKDEVSREKYRRLLAIRMETAAKRDEIRTAIDMLRNERPKFERDTPAYMEKTEAILIQGNRIARIKEQAGIEMEKVKGDAYATRLQLDEDARQLSNWLNSEKLKIQEQYAQEHQDDQQEDPASTTNNQ